MSGSWTCSFPYETQYNDHFETPLTAYEDILPLLDLIAGQLLSQQNPSFTAEPRGLDEDDGDTRRAEEAETLQLVSDKKRRRKKKGSSAKEKCVDDRSLSKQSFSAASASFMPIPPSLVQQRTELRSNLVLFDPYYCNGRTKSLLESLGFHKVIHRKRDFYQDVKQKSIPNHDVFISNPPYSGDHKERCLEFAIKNLRENGRPFFLLMPNYVAVKDYYKKIIHDHQNKDQDLNDMVYIIPPRPYKYEHPEGTGHDNPPFESIWFCGVGNRNIHKVISLFNQVTQRKKECTKHTSWSSLSQPRLATSIKELQRMGAVSNMCRPNPRQRRKKRKQQQGQSEHRVMNSTNISSQQSAIQKQDELTNISTKQIVHLTSCNTEDGSTAKKYMKRKSKKSIYRDASGNRKRKRF